MHISIFMGPFARNARDDRPLIEYCLKSAEQAASDGFSLVSFGEQHFNNYEPYCNPLLMAARLSPLLGQTWYATTILPLPYHNPIRLAEDLNVVDQLLKGRFIAGMSAGRIGFSPDFENFGLDPKAQRTIFDEKMAALKTLWSHADADGPIHFDSEWVRGGMHGRLMPVSYRAPHPLIAIGSNTDPRVRQAGVDGNVLFLGPCPIEEATAKLALFREGLQAGGHDQATIKSRIDMSMVHHQFVVADTDDAAWAMIEKMMGFHPLLNRREDKRTLRQMNDDGRAGKPAPDPVARQNEIVVSGWIVAGSPRTVIDAIRERESAGFGMVHTRFAFGPYDPPAWDRNYAMFVEQVLPHVGCTLFPPPAQGDIQAAVSAGPLPPGGPPRGPMGIPGANANDPARGKPPSRA